VIPKETVDQIVDAARIEDVIGDFVTLKRRGANLVACCPFHNEKTPSFYVSPAKGLYKCFGCGKAGSAVGFLMEHEHLSYSDALRYLAKKYNIEIVEKDLDPQELMERQRRESVVLASEFGLKFFSEQLSTQEGRAVGYQYFRSRGLEDATISKFGLGWAPSGRTALIDAAVKAGFKMEYILAAGLAVQREDGSVVDKFHERVMFPIHTVSGRVVAFSGRTLKSDNPAKYVNTAETEIYSKSHNLLGIYFAKAEMNRTRKCILVEGNVDMVTMHQLGITNVVASCGTSLTVDQIRLIRRFADDVTIMYDGDSAGIHAALRGIGLVLEEGLNVKVILLPDGDDPDSFCRKHTLEEVQDYIARNERDFIEFKTDLLLREAGRDPIKRANLINDVADTIALIPDAVKRTVYAESTSEQFGIESQIIFDRILQQHRKRLSDGQKGTSAASEQKEEAQAGPVYENKVLAPVEKELIFYLLKYGATQMRPETGLGEEKPVGNLPAVADFIRGSLEADGVVMQNSAFAATYGAYFAEYDAGKTQEQIVRNLLNCPDPLVAQTATRLADHKYEISVKKLASALTDENTWLMKYVPKTLICYMERRLFDEIDKTKRRIAAGEGDEMENLSRMLDLQKKHRIIEKKLRESN